MTDTTIINMLRMAIDLAGDGGPTPFSDEEYEEMNKFLDKIENEVNTK